MLWCTNFKTVGLTLLVLAKVLWPLSRGHRGYCAMRNIIVRHCVSGGSVCHCGGTYWSRLCGLSGITRVPKPLYSTGQPNLVGVVFVFRLAAALSRGKRPRHCGRRLCRSYHRPNSACTAAQLQLLLHLRRRWVVRCFLAALVHVRRSAEFASAAMQCETTDPIEPQRSSELVLLLSAARGCGQCPFRRVRSRRLAHC